MAPAVAESEIVYNILNSEFVKYDYDRWIRYFRHNSGQRLRIDFSGETELSSEQRKRIFPSITAFQKGERSEGGYFLSAAERFAEEKKEPSYTEAVRYFIKEENTHSAYLAQYMKWHRVPEKKYSVLDSIFRRLRQVNGIRSEVTVLVTAEIIALSYYTALKNATKSSALKSICSQMLHDELPHVVFQSYTLAHFHNTAWTGFQRRALMMAACLAVWTAYRSVFRSGGYSLRRFLQNSLLLLHRSDVIARKTGW